MRNSKDVSTKTGLTSNSFLVNVMPHIKISQKNFPLNGIEPALNQDISSSVRWESLKK